MLEFGGEPTRVANPVRPPRCDYAIGTFLGERVEASLEDLAPVKNHLPPKLGVRLKTGAQWSELGFQTRLGVEPVLMRPTRGRRPCEYYRRCDVEPMGDRWALICASCAIRGGSPYCPVAGRKVSMFNSSCSEWRPRDLDPLPPEGQHA